MSDHIRFLCSTCKAVMDAPVRRASTKINCLKCGQRLQIPAAEHARTILAAPSGVNAGGAVSAADNFAWHVVRKGKQLGPVSTEELKQLAAFGELLTQDVVWKEGMASWVQAGKIKGLFTATVTASASSAVPLCPQALTVNVVSQASAIAPEHRKRAIAIMPGKSMGLAILLTIFFGPLGMLYSTVAGGLLMMLLGAILFVLTICPLTMILGALLFLLFWPICVIWAALAVNSCNDKLARYYS